MDNSVNNSISQRNVCYAMIRGFESEDGLTSDLCSIRKQFFLGGKIKRVINSKAVYMGYNASVKAKITTKSFTFKKKLPSVIIEEIYRIDKNFVAVKRDINGYISSKIYYDLTLNWIETKYFDPDDYVYATHIIKPVEGKNEIELSIFDREVEKYLGLRTLYPNEYDKSNKNEILNKFNDEEYLVFVEFDNASFIYSSKILSEDDLKDISKNELEKEEKISQVEETKDEEYNYVFESIDEKVKTTDMVGTEVDSEIAMLIVPTDEIEVVVSKNQDESLENAQDKEIEALDVEPLDIQEQQMQEETPLVDNDEKDKQSLETTEEEILEEKTLIEEKEEFIEKVMESVPLVSEKSEETIESENQLDLNENVIDTISELKEESVQSTKDKGVIKILENMSDIEKNSTSQRVKYSFKKHMNLDNHINYTGTMYCGNYEGRGRTEQKNGLTIYDGMFSDGKKHGFGSFYSKDGKLKYSGYFNKGKKDGIGVSFREKDMAMHISKWNEGNPGEMVYLFDENANLIYSGRTVDGKKKGGFISYNSEKQAFVLNKFSEDGKDTKHATIFDSDGNLMYSGGFEKGMREGFGIEFDEDGKIVYEGMFKNDKYIDGILRQKIKE